jgi:hypothetical protein
MCSNSIAINPDDTIASDNWQQFFCTVLQGACNPIGTATTNITQAID